MAVPTGVLRLTGGGRAGSRAASAPRCCCCCASARGAAGAGCGVPWPRKNGWIERYSAPEYPSTFASAERSVDEATGAANMRANEYPRIVVLVLARS